MTVKWIPTSAKSYSALREFHGDSMRVHGTITDVGSYHGSIHLMTEFGLSGADYPLVKRDDRDGISSYWIAVVTKDEES